MLFISAPNSSLKLNPTTVFLNIFLGHGVVAQSNKDIWPKQIRIHDPSLPSVSRVTKMTCVYLNQLNLNFCGGFVPLCPWGGIPMRSSVMQMVH